MRPLLFATGLCSAALLSGVAHATEDGIVGYAWTGCGECHEGNDGGPSDVVSVRFLVDGEAVESLIVAGGETVAFGFEVASTDPIHQAAGLDVGATDGTLAGSATLLWRVYEVSHQYPHAMTDGVKVFDLTWTAPAWAGEVVIGGAGNAVDFGGDALLDGWQLGTLAVTVEADCADADGDKVGDCEGDCDDTDAGVYPGAEETWYDGVDSDCDGADDNDADGDGVPLAEDCDDADPERAEDCDTGEPDADDTGGDEGGAGADDGGDVGGDGASDAGDSDTGADGEGDGGCGGGKALVLPLGLGALLGLRRRRQWRSQGGGV